MLNRRAVWALLLATLCGLPLAAHARVITLSASGQGLLDRAGGEAARRQAIDTAVRRALDQTVQLAGGPRIGEDPVMDAQVYARHAAFVRAYRVLGQERDGNLVHVHLAVDIDVGAVEAALGGRKAPARPDPIDLGRRRVLLLLTEQLGPSFIGWTDFIWGPFFGQSRTTIWRLEHEMGGMEAVFSKACTAAGLAVIDPAVLRGRLAPPPPALRLVDPVGARLRQLATAADADLVLLARGNALIAEAAGGIRSAQGNVVARLVRIRDGQVLATASQHGTAAHLDTDTALLNAVNEAARQAARELLSQFHN